RNVLAPLVEREIARQSRARFRNERLQRQRPKTNSLSWRQHVASPRDQELIVRGKGDVPDGDRVAQTNDLDHVRKAPNPGGAIRAPRGQVTAVMAERHRAATFVPNGCILVFAIGAPDADISIPR